MGNIKFANNYHIRSTYLILNNIIEMKYTNEYIIEQKYDNKRNFY